MDPFTALADPVRRSLLRSLRSGPARVVDLAADLPISRPAVSKHLRLLTEAGLVRATVRGRERHYAVTPDGLAPVADLVAELSAERAGPATAWPLDTSALDALDTEVRRTGRDRRTAEPAAATHPQHHEETA
jgi:DNA-binding transcriptional ArsR family regulator